MSRKSVGRRGLSLIEVLVALAVVVIALFAIAATQVAAFTANVQAREIAVVRDIATESVAGIRSVILEYAYQDADYWPDMLDPITGTVKCSAPTKESLMVPSIVKGSSGPDRAQIVTDGACGGDFVLPGPDGVEHTVRWRFGVPGDATVVGVTSPQLALLQVLVRVDWERRGVERSMAFEDFVGCVDFDSTTCPDGPPAGG